MSLIIVDGRAEARVYRMEAFTRAPLENKAQHGRVLCGEYSR